MKNITPEPLMCLAGACPKLFEDGDDLVIVGQIVKDISVGQNEMAVRVPKGLFANLKK